MTRISKHTLDNSTWEKILDLFFKVIEKSTYKMLFFSVIDDVLSPTEKVMIAKRVAIIYLLIKEIDQRTIATILKVSQSTVSHYAFLLYKRESELVRLMKHMIVAEKSLDFLEDILTNMLIQPGVMKGHTALAVKHINNKRNKKRTGF